MTLKEKLQWSGEIDLRLEQILADQEEIKSGKAQKVTYYWHAGKTVWYAIETFAEGNSIKAKEAANLAVAAALDYFYGNWREELATEDGKVGTEAWKDRCLWYDEVLHALSFSAALSNWEAVAKLALYPPEYKLPEAAKAKGETAWGWALITFLRGKPMEQVESFIAKTESDRAKRPKLLCAVLRALMDKDPNKFEQTFQTYMTFYRKQEFKRVIDKIVSLDGTTLYHLGRKQGFKINLTEDLLDHILRY